MGHFPCCQLGFPSFLTTRSFLPEHLKLPFMGKAEEIRALVAAQLSDEALGIT